MFANNTRNLFYRDFTNLYFALVLQNVITLSVNLVDNIMLGAYSESALSGATAANQVQFVFQQIIMALGDGLIVLASQYWGKKLTEPLKYIFAISMQLAIIITVALFAVTAFFPSKILMFFTSDKEIISEGCKYLSIVKYSYFFFAVSSIIISYLRSVEIVKIAFVISMIVLFINCGINYLLIFGNMSMPEIGIMGAAIGTLVARVIEFIVLVVYVTKNKKCIANSINLHVIDCFKTNRKLSNDYMVTSVPMLVVQSLWGLNSAMQTVILGHMSSEAIAANSVASTVYLLVKSTAVGASQTASVLIGRTIGEGNHTKTKYYSKHLQITFIIIGCISGVVLYFIRIPILSLYNIRSITRQLANQFLIVLSIVNVGMTYQMPVNNGIIRGGGSTAFVAKMDIICIWIIVIPLSLIMAFAVHASPVIVVICLNADQVFKCVPAFIKVNYGHWEKKLI